MGADAKFVPVTYTNLEEKRAQRQARERAGLQFAFDNAKRARDAAQVDMDRLAALIAALPDA